MTSAALEVLRLSLDAMSDGPASLAENLRDVAKVWIRSHPGEQQRRATVTEALLVRAVRESGRQHPLALVLHQRLLKWDCIESATWTGDSGRCTRERRDLIYRRLHVGRALRAALETACGPVLIDAPTVIAEEHERWYTPARGSGFYWQEYERYLGEVAGWPGSNILRLDESTTQVVERLADPYQAPIYQSKGLVVGYVQSGKTANFTGVIAKAADSGYRLFIVLAGMMDVLRNQTQRRLDKELVGKEILQQDGDDYAADPEFAGDTFVSHGYPLPRERGHYNWHRFTGPGQDFRGLGRAVDALKIPRVDREHPLNHPSNLTGADARLLVLKKNSAVLGRLVRDLKNLSIVERRDIPALIIDDESDQASIDTRRRPSREDADALERNAVNRGIVSLLKLLPRSQYVGYTATPFANVFVNPGDHDDIFPKDFIVSLRKPDGYMGVAEFFDAEDVGGDATVTTSNEKAFVRSIRGNDDAPENLQRALDAFVLSGALKLYRASRAPSIAKHFKHHTMLVHRSPWKKAHEADARFVLEIFERCAHGTRPGLKRLEELFVTDYEAVSRARGVKLPFPSSFKNLVPYVRAALQKMREQEKFVRIVNGDNNDDTPNFELGPIWGILVGGAKLSRGYTVEGLTTSYYRRTANASDTLLQMGRWFGFRRGYCDLVRLFVGREEIVGTTRPPRKGKVARPPRTLDLLEAFKAICRDEEEFRKELGRYASMDDPRITPRMIPPLVPYHLLRPTSPNKMRYAELVQENFGGRWRDPTSAPTESEGGRVRWNERQMRTLLDGARVLRDQELAVSTDAGRARFVAHTAILTPSAVRAFLAGYRWTERDDGLLSRELEFLDGKLGDNRIRDWVLIAPQLRREARATWTASGLDFTVKHRVRVDDDGSRYKVYTEPQHKILAEYVAGVRGGNGASARAGKLRRGGRAVMLFYPVRNFEGGETITSMGFALLFPPNQIITPMKFRVKVSTKAA